nr:hypothetical protein [Tanacetum cinerariifolium]
MEHTLTQLCDIDPMLDDIKISSLIFHPYLPLQIPDIKSIKVDQMLYDIKVKEGLRNSKEDVCKRIAPMDNKERLRNSEEDVSQSFLHLHIMRMDMICTPENYFEHQKQLLSGKDKDRGHGEVELKGRNTFDVPRTVRALVTINNMRMLMIYYNDAKINDDDDDR